MSAKTPAAGAGFAGFPRGAVRFLSRLAAHNDKAWFEAHKDEYERLVREPAREFVRAMAEPLAALAPQVHADPRVNRSLFRIHRDQRRVKEGPPFKEHLGVWFWEGPGHRMACPGFYFHLEPGRVLVSAGMPWFSGELLHAYRRAAVHPLSGPELARAVEEVAGRGYGLGGRRYRRLPKGYGPQSPNRELLLHGGLYAFDQGPVPDEAFGPELVDYCLERWVQMLPLHQWLVQLARRAADSEAAPPA
jgi:uncharacterized protein (TIGR02453 family)